MLLVMDVGNSHTKLGLYDGETLVANWRIVTTSSRTIDEFRIMLNALLIQEAFRRNRSRAVALPASCRR